jgi:outer membrane cobalamin receptor
MPRSLCGLTGRALRLVLLTSFAVSAFATLAHAQALAGRVVDPQDRPVASADVMLLRGTTVVTIARTRTDGRFGPLDVAAGAYDVLVSAPGLRAAPRRVTIGADDVTLDLSMAVAAVTESVVVSAAQVDAPLSRVTDSVTVISRADLDARQTETVADALRLVPGFGVVGSGGRGAVTSIFPRGGESNYTLVLADGIPLNSFGGGFDAAHLPTAELDRVEVVRGPQSALYGSGAIGGIVQLVRRQGGPLRANALVEAGGYGTVRGSAAAAGSNGAWSWSGAFEGLTSDGDPREYPQFGGRITNDDYDRQDASGALSWSDGATRRLRVDLRHGRTDRGFPGPYGSDPEALYGGVDDISRGETRTTGLGVSGSTGDVAGLRHTGRVTWTDFESRFLSPFGESEDETSRVTARYQADVERRIVGLSAGVEIERERADNTFITGELFEPVPVERSLAGFFVETRWPVRGARGAITAGARLDRIARRALEADPGAFNDRPAFDEDVVWSANPRVSAAWFLRAPDANGSGTWTRLRAGAGTGIKPPTAFEIAFTDNPGLRPERSRSVDVGVEQALAAATVLADATWFLNRYDDLIVAVGTGLSGASRFRTDNIANARARGLELGLAWQAPRGVRVRGAVTFLDTEVLAIDSVPGQAPAPFSVGDRLLRRSPRQGSLEAHWTTARGSVFALVSGRNTFLDLEPNFASSLYDNPGHVVVTAGGALRLARGVEVFGRVANLFDEAYEDVLGFPAPGRVAFVGVRVAAGR